MEALKSHGAAFMGSPLVKWKQLVYIKQLVCVCLCGCMCVHCLVYSESTRLMQPPKPSQHSNPNNA